MNNSQAALSLTSRWRLVSSEEISVLAWPIRSDPSNQLVSGSHCFAEALLEGRVHDRAGCECGLLVAAAALNPA